MNDQMITDIVNKLALQDNLIHIIFQGGEPLLAGKKFYINLLTTIAKHSTVKWIFSIQTNGTLIDDEWIKIFSQLPNLMLGISLDGCQKTNDLNRITYKNGGTFKRIMNGLNLVKKANLNYSLLSVGTPEFVNNIKENLHFLAQNTKSIQILWPIPSVRGKKYITNDQFFELFAEQWIFFKKNFQRGYYLSNIDALCQKIITGKSVPFFDGIEVNEFVVEYDGSVFSSDFFTYDKYRIGNILDNSIVKMENHPNFLKLRELSLHQVGPKTKKSQYFNIIGPGNLRFRNKQNEFIYLEGYSRFLESYLPEINDFINNLARTRISRSLPVNHY